MSRFLQLHALIFYPPSNPNRDDAGRPKSAVVGGVPRLRISSQALKRAWRISDVFADALQGHLADRTQRLGERLRDDLVARGVAPEAAKKAARTVAGNFGKIKPETDKNPLRTEQLAFISPEERQAALDAALAIAKGGAAPEQKDLLRRADAAADVAMFGRMLADAPDFNREAAVQVAHAITTHRALVEDDYYTAVDDLKTPAEDAGAGFIGEQGFGSGVFYLYICADCALLRKNLGGDSALAGAALGALARVVATVGPGGKQNSFANRTYAHYVLAERGDRQPRSLAGAFVKPVEGDLRDGSVEKLREWRKQLDGAYGKTAEDDCEMCVGGAGTLEGIVTFARETGERAPHA